MHRPRTYQVQVQFAKELDTTDLKVEIAGLSEEERYSKGFEVSGESAGVNIDTVDGHHITVCYTEFFCN